MSYEKEESEFGSRRREASSEFSQAMNTEVDSKILSYVRRGIAGVAVAIALWSPWYVIGTNDEGVITRLGKYDRTVGSGIGFKMPWPFEAMTKVSVTEINRLEVGFKTTGHDDKGATYEKDTKESIMLTGDENLVQSEFTVQWKVKNSRDYLFNAADVEAIITQAGQAAHRQVVGDNSIDKVLTDGKDDIQMKTKMKLQDMVDRYKIGVQINNIQLQDVYAPEAVSGAFKDVQIAKENRSQLINDAKGYANDILPKARGDAQKKIEDAQGYKIDRINTAKGRVARFISVLEQYEKAPEITEARLRIAATAAVLQNAEKVLVEKTGGPLQLLNLNDKEKDGGN